MRRPEESIAPGRAAGPDRTVSAGRMCGTDAVSAFASTCGYARRLRAGLVLALLLALTGCAGAAPAPAPASTPLHGKVICVDPGHGGTAATDPFRVGPAGEREEWINLRVALALRELLERSGAHVVMTRTEDVAVPLADRAHLARYARADVFISIHHNATADPAVNLPIVYFHGNASENLAGVALGRILLRRVRRALYTDATPIALVSDLAIYPGSGASVLRNTYGIPAVICEASFFTDPDEEQRLRALSYNRREALAYLESLGEFLGAPVPPIAEKRLGIPPFPVLEAAARSSGAALRWNDLYREGVALARDDADRAIRARALALLTESVRVFPDSPVARAAHLTRARLLAGLGRDGDAEVERLRAREHYVAIE